MLCSVDSSGRIEAKMEAMAESRVMSQTAYGSARVCRSGTGSPFFYSLMLASAPRPVSSSLSPHHSLGRRRSSSSLLDAASDQQPLSTAVSHHQPTQSMIVVVVSRILQWLHLQPQHSLSWPSPPSPRSSTEKLVLPLSASSQKTSFTDVPSEESRTHHFPSVSVHLC